MHSLYPNTFYIKITKHDNINNKVLHFYLSVSVDLKVCLSRTQLGILNVEREVSVNKNLLLFKSRRGLRALRPLACLFFVSINKTF